MPSSFSFTRPAPLMVSVSEDLPIVVEIVDSQDKIDDLMPFLDEAVQEGLVTVEQARVIKYRVDGPAA